MKGVGLILVSWRRLESLMIDDEMDEVSGVHSCKLEEVSEVRETDD